MNISLYDFKNLPNQDQSELVINEGRIMNERVLNTFKYVLYEISFFSVEVIYNIENGKIEGMNVFQNKAAYSN